VVTDDFGVSTTALGGFYTDDGTFASSTPTSQPPPSSTGIVCGQQINDKFLTSDGTSKARQIESGSNYPYYAHDYTFSGKKNDVITLTMTTAGINADTFIYLLDANGNVVAKNDDDPTLPNSSNSRLTNFKLPASGTYSFEATSYPPLDTYAYSASLSCPSNNQAPVITLTSPALSAPLHANGLLTVPLKATANDPDGLIAKVQFFVSKNEATGVQYGNDFTNPPYGDSTAAPFTWSIPSTAVAGDTFTIYALATDDSDTSTTSNSVIIVYDPNATTVTPTPTPVPSPTATPTPTPPPPANLDSHVLNAGAGSREF